MKVLYRHLQALHESIVSASANAVLQSSLIAERPLLLLLAYCALSAPPRRCTLSAPSRRCMLSAPSSSRWTPSAPPPCLLRAQCYSIVSASAGVCTTDICQPLQASTTDICQPLQAFVVQQLHYSIVPASAGACCATTALVPPLHYHSLIRWRVYR